VTHLSFEVWQILNDHFVANFMESVSLKIRKNWLIFDELCHDKSLVVYFLGHDVHVVLSL